MFRKDLTALIASIKANALAVGLPRYLPPEIDVLHFTTQVRVREGMRHEAPVPSADDDAETEAESVAGGQAAGRPFWTGPPSPGARTESWCWPTREWENHGC